MSYDGRHTADIYLTYDYWEKTCGLCGTFDGDKGNDQTLPNGEQVCITPAMVVTSHLSFGSSRVIWSHFRVLVELSQSSHVQISMGTSHGILLESLVMSWYVTRV